jgi:predicted metal-dependent hydrolase
MSTLELEARKAELAREILGESDENRLNEWLALFNKERDALVGTQQQSRKIGLLDGKAKIVFNDDFEMTAEELTGIR